MTKWILAILALVFAITTAFVILTITGVVQPQPWIESFVEGQPRLRPYLETYRRGLEVEAWLAEQEQLLELEHQDVAQQQDEFNEARQQLAQWEMDLDAREKTLDEAFAQLERQQAELRNAQAEEVNTLLLADMYSEMRPADAAEIFERMDEATALDILRAMDPRRSSPLVAAMNRELAARLSRQLKEVNP